MTLTHQQLERLLSRERLSTYVTHFRGDFDAAVRLYRWNAALAAAMISDMKLRQVELSGDVEGSYVVETTCTDGRLLVAPEAVALATMGRWSREPVAPAEFEAICAAVRSPEGEG